MAHWNRMTLLARFTLTGCCLTVLIGVVLGWALARGQEASALEQEAEVAAESVRLVLDAAVGSDFLGAPLAADQYAVLDRLVKERLVGAHTVRIKVWSSDGTVRYSTDPAEVGQRFDPADNDELREALAGELATELSEPGKDENRGERGRGRLMEIYVPIRPHGGPVVGAYEIYHDLGLVEPQIAQLRTRLWVSVTIAFAVLYVGLYGLVRAASEHARRQTEELGRLEARREVDRLKVEFVNVITHELRAPLTGLVGFSELLLTRKAGAVQRREWLGRMHAESERMSHLVDQLLDVARIEDGRLPVDLQPVDAREIARDVLAPVRAAVGGPALREAYDAALPPVRADRDRLVQVLLNLVSNAVKYSPAGGTITVSARAVGDAVRITVADQGLGIPSEELPRLFGRFHRVGGADRQGIRGTGLGLYITRQLVEAQGGRIWAESAGPGQGSAFHVELPAEAAEPAAAPPLVNLRAG
ncbi:MAG TPA: HAMP domain-containing sensor histidine kinase [Chloroflexota bacterium]